MKKKKLGEVLRERGHISLDALSKAIEEQGEKLIRLGELLLERGLVAKADLVAALAEVTGVPYVDCGGVRVEKSVLKLIPRGVAQRCCALPLVREGSRLVAVLAEPQNLQALDELRFTSGMTIAPRFGFRSEILAAIEAHYMEKDPGEATTVPEEEFFYSVESDIPEMEFISTSSRQSNQEAMQELQAEIARRPTPAVHLVSAVIAAANSERASDIHIDPQASDTVIRIRVDGMLRELQRIPRTLQNSLVSRIKILSDMDIAERRTAQDGRFLVQMAKKKFDLRVSTLPTQYGEKVVMRLLEPHAPLLGFADLGLAREMEEELRRLLTVPQGMLLVTGPTGSGKSTMLYACLNILRKPTVNIITVEDPVEYALESVNQVQVNAKADLTFANCLRSILRQDPNIIMVGEVRDRETAEIAMKAAQTGHLVLSTLHTNDSIAAITRLLDLQIAGFMIASSVTAIMAQRLVRKLCPCHKEVTATARYAARLIAAGLPEPVDTERIPVGCADCNHTGYKGRVGIFEMLVLDEPIRDAVRCGGRIDEIRHLARSSAVRRMQEEALEKVRLGVTTLDEVLRVVPFDTHLAAGCAQCGRSLVSAFLFCPYCGATKERARTAPRLVPSGPAEHRAGAATPAREEARGDSVELRGR